MRRFITMTAAVALLGLTACNETGAPPTTSPTPPAGTGLQAVTDACQALQPTLDAVPGAMQQADASAQAKAANILSYEKSACSSAATIAAVVANDPSGGNNTAVWVTALGAGLIQALPAIVKAAS